MSISDTLKYFVAGVVTIGIITALTLNGRNTAHIISVTGQAGSGLIGRAIHG
jgi:hypothetical protein